MGSRPSLLKTEIRADLILRDSDIKNRLLIGAAKLAKALALTL